MRLARFTERTTQPPVRDLPIWVDLDAVTALQYGNGSSSTVIWVGSIYYQVIESMNEVLEAMTP